MADLFLSTVVIPLVVNCLASMIHDRTNERLITPLLNRCVGHDTQTALREAWRQAIRTIFVEYRASPEFYRLYRAGERNLDDLEKLMIRDKTSEKTFDRLFPDVDDQVVLQHANDIAAIYIDPQKANDALMERLQDFWWWEEFGLGLKALLRKRLLVEFTCSFCNIIVKRAPLARKAVNLEQLLELRKIAASTSSELDAFRVEVRTRLDSLSETESDLRALLEALIKELRGRPPLALRQLRPPTRDFRNHVAELDQLVGALTSSPPDAPAPAMVAISGLGGSGKTEFAYKLADKICSSFPDAQLRLDLRGASDRPLTAAQALQSVIYAWVPAAVLSDDLPALEGQFRSLLNGKRVLILADDALDATQVESLVPPSGSAVLVTTRNRFSVPGMARHELGLLPVSEAVALLHDICPRIGDHAELLARLCGYLPLALRICASQLAINDTRDVNQYCERLVQERLNLLAVPGSSHDPARSVEASLRLSHDALTPTAQRVLYQLSIFPTSFDRNAAVCVVESEANIDESLEELRRHSLLDWDASHQRYSLHELVRVFAAARLLDRDSVALRHARCYGKVAADAKHLCLEGGDAMLNGLTIFDQERAHLDAAWTWLRTPLSQSVKDELLLDYADAAGYIGELRYDPRREQIPQFESALESAQRLARRDAAGRIFSYLGKSYLDLGEAERAIEYHGQALGIARAAEDRREVAANLAGLGNACTALGKTHEAITYHREAHDIARQLDDPRGETANLTGLGATYLALGDTQSAIDCFASSLVKARNLGDWRRMMANLGGLGNAFLLAGNPPRSIAHYKRSLVIAKRLEDRHGQSTDLTGLANAYKALGDAQRAIESYEQGLAIARELGNRRRTGIILIGLADAYVDLKDMRRAITLYDEAGRIFRSIGDRRAESSRLGSLGNVYYAQGNIRGAIESFEQMLAIVRELGDQPGEVSIGSILRQLREEQGKLARVSGGRSMELQHGVELIDATGADLKPGSRLSLSAGAGLPDGEFSGYRYAASALIPQEPWRPPTAAELALLLGSRNVILPGRWISIVSIPAPVLDAFAELRAQVLAIDSFEEANGILAQPRWRSALSTYGDYAQRFAAVEDDVYLDKMGIRINAPGLPTVTLDYSTSTLIGLHLDSWFNEPPHRRHLSPNRIVANLSGEPRYLLYLNLPVQQISDLILGQDKREDEGAIHYAYREMLARYPSYPIVRVRLLPGEAYIAPTENIIHDGSTLGMTSWDIHLALLGRFEPMPR